MQQLKYENLWDSNFNNENEIALVRTLANFTRFLEASHINFFLDRLLSDTRQFLSRK